MRILLPEDDLRISDSAGKNLRASGFAVDIAADGRGGEEFPCPAFPIQTFSSPIWSAIDLSLHCQSTFPRQRKP